MIISPFAPRTAQATGLCFAVVLYTVRQKKGGKILLCASFWYLTETGEFFHIH